MQENLSDFTVEKTSASSVNGPPTCSHLSVDLTVGESLLGHTCGTDVRCAHAVLVCMSESSSLSCRAANRMLSSALPAGRPALSITAKYQRLLSEALEDLGRPNHSPDLNPCGAIKLKQLGVMETSTLFSWCVTDSLMLIGLAHEVM